MSTLSLARTTALVASLWIPLAGLPAEASETNPCNPCAGKEANPCNPCGAKGANPCNPCDAKGANPCNPCTPKNPCNPCTPKNPCNPCAPENPCSPKGANPCNPCGAKGANPCNPCGGSARIDPAKFTRPAGLRLEGDRATLVAEGEKLWSDTSLSTNGAACATCHTDYQQFLSTFAEPYPHEVAMVKSMSGVDQVDAAEMVQFCMVQPMQADPLPWSSTELAALAAYVEHLQAGFEPDGSAAKPAANPCNPCGARNPCSR